MIVGYEYHTHIKVKKLWEVNWKVKKMDMIMDGCFHGENALNNMDSSPVYILEQPEDGGK